MELTNSFSVAHPVDRAWGVVTDLERVAPCLPGAALLGVDGEDHRGVVRVKVGPVRAQYEGVARFVQRDDDAHHAVLRAEGRDVRGQGGAAATIDLRVRPQGHGSEVVVRTDLELAGRVAQFGRGVIADVSGKLIGQFARRLEEEMERDGAAGAGTAAAGVSDPSPVDAAPARRHHIDDVEPLDLMATGGGALAGAIGRQALPIGLAVLGLLIGWLLGRSGRRALPPPGAAAAPVLQLVLPAPVRPNGHDPEGT